MNGKTLFTVALLATAMTARATVLTFDIGGGITSSNDIPQTYGDNVTATSMGIFGYGSAGGFTPNITLKYGETFNESQSYWSTGFGNLTNVVYEESDFTGVTTLVFTAAPGFLVSLASLDLAAYTTDFASDPTINGVQIFNSLGVAIFSATNVTVSRTTRTPLMFGPNVTDTTLTLVMDARNLGGKNDDIAADNIQFSQLPTVPCYDAWTAPSTDARRAIHTAVWTGSEMIVWGG